MLHELLQPSMPVLHQNAQVDHRYPHGLCYYMTSSCSAHKRAIASSGTRVPEKHTRGGAETAQDVQNVSTSFWQEGTILRDPLGNSERRMSLTQG